MIVPKTVQNKLFDILAIFLPYNLYYKVFNFIFMEFLRRTILNGIIYAYT